MQKAYATSVYLNYDLTFSNFCYRKKLNVKSDVVIKKFFSKNLNIKQI